MVHIVVAGGTGNIAREIVEVLVKQKKHQVTIFSRKEVSSIAIEGVTAVQVDYTDKKSLIQHLRGVNTVLSFIVEAPGTATPVQRTLIDASIEAGVKRFAPSEWATRSNSGIPWYATKEIIHKYLQEVNKEKKVLEYTLFQPGLFVNYFTHPYKSGKYFHSFELNVDFQNCRAIVIGDGNDQISLTTVQDLGAVVAAAIDYEGEWPEVGGVRGGQITLSELIKLGEEIRGKSFVIDRLSKADVEAGILKSSWIPAFSHPSFSPDDFAEIAGAGGNPQDFASKMIIMGTLLATDGGAWDVSNEWNKLLPQVKLTGFEEFLRKHWEGKL